MNWPGPASLKRSIREKIDLILDRKTKGGAEMKSTIQKWQTPVIKLIALNEALSTYYLGGDADYGIYS